MSELPNELKSAVRHLIDGLGGFAAQAKLMSEHYRGGGRSDSILDLNAYLVARMPATFAAVKACLNEVLQHIAPLTMLDVGSGPGTASWAATEAFPDISKITFLDNNKQFLQQAKSLAIQSPNQALRQVTALYGNLEKFPDGLSADLVVAAYALAELPVTAATTIAHSLWRACSNTLIIVEPGTPQGFARIKKARLALIAAGAHILAPCTHSNSCPMEPSGWCHFKVRLARSREHLHAKNAKVPFEDEKFSYVIASRHPSQKQSSRILAPPTETKAEITFKLCSADGITQQSIARRDKAEYKRVRKLGWGDLF